MHQHRIDPPAEHSLHILPPPSSPQVFLEGINLGGKPLTALPALQNATIDASKALKALPQLMNITMMGMDVAKLSAMADKLNIKLPAISNEAKSSLEDLKKLPALLQVSCMCYVLFIACRACYAVSKG